MVLVRRLEPEDVQSFSAWRGGDVYLDGIVRRHLAEHAEGRRIILVAVAQAAIVGTLQLVFREEDPDLADGRTCAYLQALDVRPEWRRRDVGSRLVETAGAVAASRGYRRLTVMVEADNASALGFFQHLGFSCLKRGTHVWRGRSYPTLCLERPLPL